MLSLLFNFLPMLKGNLHNVIQIISVIVITVIGIIIPFHGGGITI